MKTVRENVLDAQERLALIRQMPRPLSLADRLSYSVKNLRVNSYLQIGDQVYKILEEYRYKDAEGYEWHEFMILSLKDGSTTFIEWEEDDGLEITLTLEEISFFDLGVSKEALRQMDDEEEGSFSFRGKTFRYEESGQATFYKVPANDGEGFMYWDFVANGTSISVEKWSDGSYKAYLCRGLRKNEVEILHLGEEAVE